MSVDQSRWDAFARMEYERLTVSVKSDTDRARIEAEVDTAFRARNARLVDHWRRDGPTFPKGAGR